MQRSSHKCKAVFKGQNSSTGGMQSYRKIFAPQACSKGMELHAFPVERQGELSVNDFGVRGAYRQDQLRTRTAGKLKVHDGLHFTKKTNAEGPFFTQKGQYGRAEMPSHHKQIPCEGLQPPWLTRGVTPAMI